MTSTKGWVDVTGGWKVDGREVSGLGEGIIWEVEEEVM